MPLLVATVAIAAATVASLLAARGDLRAARRHLVAAEDAVRTGDHQRARSELDEAARDVRRARSKGTSLPLALLRPLPVLGDAPSAVVAVADAGHQVVRAGRLLASVSESLPTSATSELHADDLGAVHAAATGSRSTLAAADRHLRAARALLDDPAGTVLPLVSKEVRKAALEVDHSRRRVAGARRGLAVVASLTDGGADARLLVLSQDTLELRPTGGYIGSYGVLHFAGGAVRLERYDATENLPAPAPVVEAPAALRPWLPSWWGLSNVNWWPDFPTTARAAQDMFARQGGGDVDGVVALTELAIARLVGAVGPLKLPSYDQPVVEQGFEQRVVHEVELKVPLDQPRKKFLIELADVLFTRLFDLAAGSVPKVASAIDGSVAAGDIQVWFADPELQALVEPTAWSGRLPPPSGDFLMLVDANLSAGKANAGVTKQATYRVRRAEDGSLLARLDVTVRNDGQYSEALNPYYNGLLRVYVPAQARPVRLRRTQRDEGLATDGRYRVLSQPIDVEPLRRQRLTFEYVLPPSVAPEGEYRLTWVRQVGTPRDAFVAVVGDDRTPANPVNRSLVIDSDLTPGGIGHFLRSRWIVRALLD